MTTAQNLELIGKMEREAFVEMPEATMDIEPIDYYEFLSGYYEEAFKWAINNAEWIMEFKKRHGIKESE